MNNPFLQSIGQRMLQRDVPLQNQMAVLPTRRASTFLKKTLSERIDGSSWLPEFTTFNTWMEDISGLKSADGLHLKFLCFEAYRKVMGSAAQDISGFFSWADVLLGDFNDIEAYMVSPKAIFKELGDYTDIAQFSFLTDPLSQKQLNYQKFWRALPLIHQALNEALLSQGLGYAGLIARKAADGWDEWVKNKGDFFVTVGGFNALSAAEAALLSKAQQSGKAEILFDVDAFYLDQKANHAGLFLRRNRDAQLGRNLFTSPSLAERPITIHTGEASSRARQVSLVSAVLGTIPAAELSDTAVVLADESLLIPMLNSLPEQIQATNITMGVGLRDTIFADWISAIWAAHESGMYSDGKFYFAAERLIKITEHPVSQLLLGKSTAGKPIQISKTARFVQSGEIDQEASSSHQHWLSPIFEPWNHNSKTAAKSVLRALDAAENVLAAQDSSDYPTKIVRASLVLARRTLKKMLATEGFRDLRPTSMLSLLLRELAAGSLALIGEPLQGLQIMGLLETRALAFKHVIICSVNEDILPHKARIDSFIPFEIRQYHRLPGKREKEAVYAYHFYRLLQHAEQAHLVYSADSQDQKGNEQSRYLHQITHELAAINPFVRLSPFAVEAQRSGLQKGILEIAKTPEVLERIKTVIETKLSASSINRYLDSPLEWYYAYVLKLKEPEKTAELDPATFGTLVHNAIEKLKEPYLNKVLEVGMLDEMLLKSKDAVAREFRSNELSKIYDVGLNKVHFEIAKGMVRRYLKSEKALIEAGERIEYLASELPLERVLAMNVSGEPIEAVFTGFADSVERRNGIRHIVDYKTGKVDIQSLGTTKFEMEDTAKKPKALQLLLYTWMGKAHFPKEEIRSQIISLPAPSDRSLLPKDDVNTPEGEAAFEALLTAIVEHMLDSSIPIAANDAFEYAVFE